MVEVHRFVATWGYSRCDLVLAFDTERQASGLRDIEGAFIYFGGVPERLLPDSARALAEQIAPSRCAQWRVTQARPRAPRA